MYVVFLYVQIMGICGGRKTKTSVTQITRDQDSDIFHIIASGMFNICHHNSYLLEPILLKKNKHQKKQ